MPYPFDINISGVGEPLLAPPTWLTPVMVGVTTEEGCVDVSAAVSQAATTFYRGTIYV